MNDEKKLTERDAVKREQKAATAGFMAGRGHDGVCIGSYLSNHPTDHCEHQTDGERFAAKHFPLPPVTRPRVVKIEGGEYRVIDGKLEVRIASASWQRPGWTVEEITTLADLIASPNETVWADS